MWLGKLRGLRVHLLLWTILPLTLLLGTIAVVSVVAHRHAMAEMVQRLDARIAQQAARALGHEMAGRLKALTAASDSRLPSETGPLFDGGIARYGSGGELLEAMPAVAVWRQRPFAGLRPGQDRALSVFFHDAPTGKYLMLLAVRQGEQTLVGAVSPDALRLTELFSHTSQPEEIIGYLIDETGRVLFHSNPDQIGGDFSRQPGVDAVLRGQSGATSFRDEQGEEWAVGYAPVEAFDLGLVVQEPWGRLEPPLMNVTLFTPLVGVAAAVAAAIAVTLGLRHVVHPLQSLDRQARQLAWGNLSALNEPVGGVQEIEDLRRTLAQMADEVRRYQGSMRDYIGVITSTQEDERKRLARELHDDTVQSLIAIGHQIERAQKLLVRDPGQAAERLEGLRQLVAGTQQAVRRFSQALRPLYLEDLGLLPAMEALVNELNQESRLRARLGVVGTSRRLSPDLELAAYRISQEAVQNVVRHAGATELEVTMVFEADALVLRIADNGIGFAAPPNPADLVRTGHFGLMGIRERALLLGGRLEISGLPGAGALLTVHLPDAR